MKAYIHNTKVGLLVGLLSFNTLSSCVHTRQELGISWGDVKRSYNRHPKLYWIGGLATTATLLGAAGTAWGISHYSGNQVNITNTNSSDATTSSPFVPLNYSDLEPEAKDIRRLNMSDATLQFIFKSIKEGGEKWGNGTGSTTERLVTTGEPL